MRIKRLEIHGFKSFADRAVLNFGAGITGVVGPNGCGKSNIIDAIRWCMGEMSAKHLRGTAMQDVIFAGSEHRGPLGMAEVTLTFLNDGDAPPQYSDYEEIAVTRRLHRDGTSEYLINKLNVRLRDIVDLFLGTGVGTRAYSIIEQGRVGFIVSSKPEQRRTLIEEVAGITKFKARKRAAERRIKSTEQNLLRVNDIIGELERQLASLKRQAQKASRYKRLRNDLRDLDLHVASIRILELLAQNKVKEVQLTQLQKDVEGGDTALAALEAGIEADKMLQLEEEECLQLQQRKSSEADTKLVALERDLDHWRQQSIDTTERIEEASADGAEAQLSIHEVREEITRVRVQIDELKTSSTDDESMITTAEEKVRIAQREVAHIEQSLENSRRDALEQVHGSAQQRTHLASLEKQYQDISQRLEVAREEQQSIQAQELQAAERRAELSERNAALTAELDRWKERHRIYQEQFDVLTATLEENNEQLFASRSELAERKARLSSLLEIAARLEDFPDGIRVLLGKGDDSDAPEVPETVSAGILGTVAETLTTDEKFEKALESALGTSLQYLVVENRKAGLAAIDFLRETDAGRGGFLPKEVIGAGVSETPRIEGTLGRAIDLVNVDSQYNELAQVLLHSIYFVESLDAATQLLDSSPDAFLANTMLVTLDGDCISKAGRASGGAVRDGGVFAKQREVRELEEMVEVLDSRIETLVEKQEELSQQRLQTEIDLQQLDKDIRSSEIELVELSKDLEASGLDVVRYRDRSEVLAYEVGQRSEELEDIQRESTTTLVAAQEAEASQQSIETRIEELQTRRLSSGEELELCSEGLTVLKVKISGRDEQFQAMKLALDRSVFTESELVQRIERNEKISTEGRELVLDLRERLSEAESSSEALVLEAQRLREAVSEARAVYEEKRSGISKRESELRDMRRGGQNRHEQLNQCRMDLQRMEMDRIRILDQIEERYDLNLLSVMGDYHHRGIPGEEEAHQKAELERKIKGMGSINLTAIEECAEVEERHQFLSEQRQDLQDALDSLRRAINRINRVSRERFQVAFHSVNEMFKKVFPRLFRGGEARLELVDSDDMLEAGVDIIAMPPGKKLQNVGLLSGGEKALTATALIFSIFLIKPSPFCVLDEVDAPLDEANVGRFNEMLREISKVSQFIVITHNKNTMTSIDRLYGITMEDPGMSKVVSVNLEAVPRTRAA